MRVLLDNCVNHRFGRHFLDREVVHVRDLGWTELSNGKLLAAAEEAGFGVLLTVDKSIRKQQNLKGKSINLLTLDTPSILIEDIILFVSDSEAAIRHLEASDLKGQDVLVVLTRPSPAQE